MASLANELLADVNLARSEAVKRRVPVTLCKSPDGAECDDDADAPFGGWLVYVDDADPLVEAATDGNGEVDAGEEVLASRSVPEAIDGAATGLGMVFLLSGFPDPGFADTIDRVVLCDERGNLDQELGSPARLLTVSATGRAAVTRSYDEIDAAGGCE